MLFGAVGILALVCLATAHVIPQIDDVDRIVGGHNVTIEQIPWQVSLERANTGRHFCGGSIIDRFTILTAAHCVREGQEAQITVHFGSTDRTGGGSYRSVRRVVPHEFFNSTTLDNDIALLILQYPILYSESAQPVSLPEFDYDLRNNATLLISGWGRRRTENETELPEILQEAEIKVVDQEACAGIYRDTPNVPDITDNMFCAGVLNEGGIDTCQGDSGGPVVHRSELGNYQHGVVSWGYGCALVTHPGVYTRVSRYLQWIELNQQLNE